MPIYVDEETGRPITTNSMVKTFRTCAKQTEYKYVHRLKPRIMGKPLRQGDWMHKLFETHYKGGDWRETHARLTGKFAELFDEERDQLGDLPTECARIMTSYLWHYELDPWTVHNAELMLEADLPDGSIFRVKIDLLVEDQHGLWLADHKFNAKRPDLSNRMLDTQSALYVWVARRMGIKVNGFIWNYVKRKAPTVPVLLKSGARLSAKAIDTDYPTMLRAIRAYGLDPKPYYSHLRRLKAQRFEHGMPQMSPFYQRHYFERQPEVLKRVATEALHTSKRMHNYPFDRPDIVERNPGFACRYCSYRELCELELFGGDIRRLLKQRYETVDPMYYYFDDPKDRDGD